MTRRTGFLNMDGDNPHMLTRQKERERREEPTSEKGAIKIAEGFYHAGELYARSVAEQIHRGFQQLNNPQRKAFARAFGALLPNHISLKRHKVDGRIKTLSKANSGTIIKALHESPLDDELKKITTFNLDPDSFRQAA